MSLTVIETISGTQEWVNRQKAVGLRIGFVPTMGALHEGHISLISRALDTCDTVIVSIFVNPTQFNNPEDLLKYPRTIERDSRMLEASGCDLLFYPSVEEMYPELVTDHWDFGLLSHTLEGSYRPGHFNGVLTIVKKLFEAVNPDEAFFGEKDFQQLSLIRRMAEYEKMPIQVIGCPIIREADGLAMSSRNMRLSAEERQQAHALSATLFMMRARAGELSPAALIQEGRENLQNSPGVRLEYLEIVDSRTFAPLSEWRRELVPIILLAAYVGEVRLIDNVFV